MRVTCISSTSGGSDPLARRHRFRSGQFSPVLPTFATRFDHTARDHFLPHFRSTPRHPDTTRSTLQVVRTCPVGNAACKNSVGASLRSHKTVSSCLPVAVGFFTAGLLSLPSHNAIDPGRSRGDSSAHFAGSIDTFSGCRCPTLSLLAVGVA